LSNLYPNNKGKIPTRENITGMTLRRDQTAMLKHIHPWFLVWSVLLIIFVFCVLLCLCVLLVFVLCLMYSMLPVSPDCPFLIDPSVFSNVYKAGG